MRCGLLLLCAVPVWLCACTAAPPPPPPQAAGSHSGDEFPALTLPASFVGTLPCADCEGIAWHLDLWPDGVYHLRQEWLGRRGAEGRPARASRIGRWGRDARRRAIVLSPEDTKPTRWEVAASERLRLLDIDGNPIESSLNYDIVSGGTLRETDLEGLTLGGMMTYYADAALLEVCATGRRYPIAQEDAYINLEKVYREHREAPGSPLYVEVEASLLLRPAMEGADRRSVIVHRVIAPALNRSIISED